MSISSDGILAFGWNLGDDIELEWMDLENRDLDRVEEIEDRLLEKLANFTEHWTSEAKDYWQRRHALEQTLGVEVLVHCAYEYPMWFLAARGSEKRAYRGSTVEIESLDEQDQWRVHLRRAAEALDLKDLGEPAWHLFSVMG